MIDRYTTTDMNAIWSEENKFRTWLEVELAVCKVWNERGVIPSEAYDEICAKADFRIERINEIEEQVQHDVSFRLAGGDRRKNGRYIHLGLTIIDTAFFLFTKRSLTVVDEKVVQLISVVNKRAEEFRYTPCAGRTHGIHGEPTTFGLKLMNWQYQLQRDRQRIALAVEQINYGKISGAVGTYAHCDPDLEKRVCDILGLRPALVSTQILQRDRHANILNTLALLGSALDRFATEIRHLQRTEVMEVLEPFGARQKGSSAMPHKRNLILVNVFRCEQAASRLRAHRNGKHQSLARTGYQSLVRRKSCLARRFSLICYMFRK